MRRNINSATANMPKGNLKCCNSPVALLDKQVGILFATSQNNNVLGWVVTIRSKLSVKDQNQSGFIAIMAWTAPTSVFCATVR